MNDPGRNISDTMSLMGQSARDTTANLQQGINNAATNFSGALNNAEQAISNTGQQVSQNIQSFGSQVGTQVSNTEFLSTNSIVAKTVFILLLLIVFLILFRVGVYIMQYIFSPNPNPYIVNGMMSGNTSTTISRNPNVANSVVLPRSNNQPDGLEATWSFWLNISQMNRSEADKNRFMHVFNVGESGNWDSDTSDGTTGLARTNNAPGVYLLQDLSQDTTYKPANSGFVKLHIIMDTESPADTASQTSIEVENLPYNKWFHVAIRLENTVMDVYVNGLLTERLVFQNVPKQNFYDINICQNGGFDGSLSNLQYFSRALNVFDINNILFWGPNLNLAQIAGSSTAALPNYNYLSGDWYFNKLGAMKY